FGSGRLGSLTHGDGDAAALRVLADALDAGITFFDTADIYGQGASEKLLGKAIRSRREQVVIATKAGYCLSPMGNLAKRFKPLLRRILRVRPGLTRSVQRVRAAQTQQNFSREYLFRAVDASLRRLRVDAIDLFQLHSPPAEVLERGEVFETLAALQQLGKIRHSGVACLIAEHVPLAMRCKGLATVQVEMNMLTPTVFGPVLDSARSAGVGVVARQIFASGLLLRSSASLTKEDCSHRAEGFPWVKERLQRLEALAADLHATVPELAIQFLRGTAGLSNILVGTTNVTHLRKNLEVFTRPPLGNEKLSRIAEIIGLSRGMGTGSS
ncbi:MAG TPA: aldo/keto reductase, partial [Verrucomicrobiae bacterium]|nr:aldo/keto reductase [Verrucomicrobiae bacterium]